MKSSFVVAERFTQLTGMYDPAGDDLHQGVVVVKRICPNCGELFQYTYTTSGYETAERAEAALNDLVSLVESSLVQGTYLDLPERVS